MEHKAVIEEMSWDDVKNDVKSVNSALYEVVESIKPTDLTVFKARYPYGAKICDYGSFYLPSDDGSVVPIDSPKVPSRIRDALNYNPMPVSLVLNNNVEVFSELDSRFIPIETFTPGTLFGTWEIFDEPQIRDQTRNWSFSAGARSIFMLPKISNDAHHRRLVAKYKVAPSSPKYLSDQHNIFTAISNNKSFEEPWYNEIIFFPSKWIEKANASINNNKWLAFKYLLLNEAWKYSSNWRYQLSINLVWRALSLELDKKNMHARPYLVDTIKHLISIAIGTALAFRPATNSNSAPIRGLQDVYISDYGINDYMPTIMEPCYLHNYDEPVYYSLQNPTLLACPQSGFRSTMKDLQDVQYLMDLLLYQLKKENLSIYSLIKDVKFDYFHSESNKSGYIVSLTKDIPAEDDRFLKLCGDDKPSTLLFPNTASYLRGCVRLVKSM